jgi:hypothetical protein
MRMCIYAIFIIIHIIDTDTYNCVIFHHCVIGGKFSDHPHHPSPLTPTYIQQGEHVGHSRGFLSYNGCICIYI